MLRRSLATSVGRLQRGVNFPQAALRAFSGTTSTPPFEKILVANRGEIACRVFRTAKRMGVKTVAVYSEADASGLHVRMADEAYCIGPAASADSYLQMERIIEVAKKSGAGAIHPGYGFLSENSKFVEMVEAAGIAFVGPDGGPMEAMGDKINSKLIAKNAGCFVIPGFEGEVADEDDAVKLSNEIGYPVMIKASAGGGGKGMRTAFNDAEVRDGFRMSKAEAIASFGDDRMLIERFIEDPHHIEIQVVADTHGNVIAFPERECSVQRRNQKVVEESPSCLLLPETRRAMQEQAIALCKATNYRSAGTVEMLCDSKQNFYFLEMNTRLQVEHPITELVGGEDLVEHMINVAAGIPLPERLTKQTFVPIQGWAMESRVYAEDPFRNFLPSIGPLITYKEPELFEPSEEERTLYPGKYAGGSTVRIDTGVFEGGTISMWYDPMICKLVVHGKDRDETIKVMNKALDQYVVQGLGNNLPFLRDVMRNPVYKSGDYSTKFIEEQYPDGFLGVELDEDEINQVVGTACAIYHAQQDQASTGSYVEGGAEMAASPTEGDEIVVLVRGDGITPPASGHLADTEAGYVAYRCLFVEVDEVLQVIVSPADDPSKAKSVIVNALDWVNETKIANIQFGDEDMEVHHDDDDDDDDDEEENYTVVQYIEKTASGFKLQFKGSRLEMVVRSPLEHDMTEFMLPEEKVDYSNFVLCPMPGTLVSCSVEEGDSVELGQEVAVVEAMKMQNVIRAEKKGVISKVHAKVGGVLRADEAIVEFESDD
jgi:propionyl-CoA carboxylase alpha chain